MYPKIFNSSISKFRKIKEFHKEPEFEKMETSQKLTLAIRKEFCISSLF